jgi:probable phosphoglycerate mutase
MRRLLLARHGETAWNAIGRMQGHTDIALNDTGRDQARALAAALGAGTPASAVVTSDLSRAWETGEIIAAALGVPLLDADPELRERRFGVFEGLTREQCAEQYPDAWRAWISSTQAPPGGEPRDAAVARLSRALARIAAAASAGGASGGPVVVISHGGIMRLWLMSVGREPVHLIPNGATYVVDHDGTDATARRWDAPP